MFGSLLHLICSILTGYQYHFLSSSVIASIFGSQKSLFIYDYYQKPYVTLKWKCYAAFFVVKVNYPEEIHWFTSKRRHVNNIGEHKWVSLSMEIKFCSTAFWCNACFSNLLMIMVHWGQLQLNCSPAQCFQRDIYE